MKYLTVFIALIALVLPVMAEESSESIQMGDFDKTLQGFSLNRGELIIVDMEEEGLPLDIDFIFDMPNGLGMNNKELAPVFSGTAGIIDLGPVPLNDDSDIPAEGFTLFLVPEDIIPGHTYLIRTADAEHSGKIQIVQFDVENQLLEFTWVYSDK
ncbi:MAG: hypothetical protein KAR20_27455 [Candidatus Heimdallarchaeota archaeon]|nr:hypothetical protein [Candidatus Heimdallarchaeota archaeon]